MELQTLSDEKLYEIMVQARLDFQKKIPIPEVVKTEVRRRAKSDLFFISKYFLGFGNKENSLMTENTHRRVCDLFVVKDDTKTIGEQDWRKERLILYPRGSFKALDLNTKIPTPNGFSLMKDISVGDNVFDETGNITEV